MSETDIVKCTSEEADPRIVRHVINLGKLGYTNVRVKTVDSDVVMLCLAHADIALANGIEKYIVMYGTKGKTIDIISNFNKFGVDVCEGLPFFHAFTGCDTVSSLYKVGKAKFWTIWLAKIKAGDKSLCTIFKKLSNCPKKIEVNDFDKLCNFVYEAYGLTKQAPFKSRRTDHLISIPNVNLRMLVPSTSGILQHIKRACIQAGYLWKLCELEIAIPNPIDWGWKRLADCSFVPRWQDEVVTDNIKSVIATCSCAKGECKNCSCKKSKLKCLIYCKCDKGKCKNK